jgi:hypothetical protein
MINNSEELIEFVSIIPCGDALFELIPGDRSISIKPMNKFTAKDNLYNSGYWLHQLIASNISRTFCHQDHKWIPKQDTTYKVKQRILTEELMNAIRNCSNSKMAERTALYKEYRVIVNRHDNNTAFLDAIIGVLNYYHSAPTDETCKSNVLGLLTILRKKYAATSGS